MKAPKVSETILHSDVNMNVIVIVPLQNVRIREGLATRALLPPVAEKLIDVLLYDLLSSADDLDLHSERPHLHKTVLDAELRKFFRPTLVRLLDIREYSVDIAS